MFVNKSKAKSLLAGFLSTAVILSSVTMMAGASSGSTDKKISITYNNIKVNLNSSQLSLKDANKNTVKPFIYNGSVYLPLRAVSEALGLTVAYDSATKVVALTSGTSTTTGSSSSVSPMGTPPAGEKPSGTPPAGAPPSGTSSSSSTDGTSGSAPQGTPPPMPSDASASKTSTGSTTSDASTTEAKETKNITVTFSGITVTLNGETIALKDASGNTVEPFIYNGSVYLPLRALATALNLTVAYSETSKTVDLTGASMGGNGGPGGTPPGGTPPSGTTGTTGSAPGGGSATVDHGTYATLVTADATGTTYSSTGDQENAVRVSGSTVTLTDITINKTAGASGSGDASNFYGANAGLLAMDKANVTINGASVTTSANGANGIFSYGEGTKVTVNDATIKTSANSSGGIMVTGGGTMYVNDSTITTQGGSSAALRTDRGGGTLVVDGGTYTSNGNGSPAIYSTATISASNATLTATASEALVIEGKNSINLTDCVVTGKMIKDNVENLQNVMIYQSMSGDAATGTSNFTMTGGSLTANNGDMIYVTNTSCLINLTDVDLTLCTSYSNTLLKIVGNDARNGWGTVGSNGGQCVFTATRQIMAGDIIVDEISTLNAKLTSGTVFTGTINNEKQGGKVDVTIDSTSTWKLTGDSYITSLTGGTTTNIDTNGYTLYVNGVASTL
ncbi:MAG: copper amine oxidase N-terminal domain-containing protein [Clostridiales bacterium]|nr:copper amine oxidase N-terminal domain-containing protein [Clostridiales bacterium]